jgi:Zn-finger nucleic acid-binding protein
LVISDRTGIEIDYCPKCRGVWLDRGELDKILERSAQYAPASATAAPPPAPPPSAGGWTQPPMPPQGWGGHAPAHGYGQGHYDPRYGHKRRKSWLEELFD